MAVETLKTDWTVTYTGANDDNLLMHITIDRQNNALAGLSDFTIVDFIRDQLATFTGQPVSVEKIESVRTTE